MAPLTSEELLERELEAAQGFRSAAFIPHLLEFRTDCLPLSVYEAVHKTAEKNGIGILLTIKNGTSKTFKYDVKTQRSASKTSLSEINSQLSEQNDKTFVRKSQIAEPNTQIFKRKTQITEPNTQIFKRKTRIADSNAQLFEIDALLSNESLIPDFLDIDIGYDIEAFAPIIKKVTKHGGGLILSHHIFTPLEESEWKAEVKKAFDASDALCQKCGCSVITKIAIVFNAEKEAEKFLGYVLEDLKNSDKLDLRNAGQADSNSANTDYVDLDATNTECVDLDITNTDNEKAAEKTYTPAKRRVIAIPMGENLEKMRKLASLMGSVMQYAYLVEPNAPGQPSLKSLIYKIS